MGGLAKLRIPRHNYGGQRHEVDEVEYSERDLET